GAMAKDSVSVVFAPSWTLAQGDGGWPTKPQAGRTVLEFTTSDTSPCACQAPKNVLPDTTANPSRTATPDMLGQKTARGRSERSSRTLELTANPDATVTNSIRGLLSGGAG